MDIFRPLYTPQLAEPFVKGVLELGSSEEIKRAAKKVSSAEMALRDIKGNCSHESDKYLDSDYLTRASRLKLHQRIVYELTTTKRLTDDDDIKLGTGGALPNGQIKKKKQAYIITGLPASRKSYVSNIIADEYGAVIVDCDYAKRKLPEFHDVSYGAYLVHEESSDIVYKDVLLHCLEKDYNMVIPKIGYNKESLRIAHDLHDAGYDIHLLLVSLDRKKATQRAYNRFIESGRYVPLSLIFDIYGNDPILTYYRIKNEPWLKTWGKITSDVDRGKNPEYVEGSKSSPCRLFINIVNSCAPKGM